MRDIAEEGTLRRGILQRRDLQVLRWVILQWRKHWDQGRYLRGSTFRMGWGCGLGWA